MRIIFYTVGVLSLLVAVAIVTGSGLRFAIYVYDEVRPFVTRYASPFCMSRLEKRDIQFTKLPDQGSGQCRILNAVKVGKFGETNLKTPVIMTCGLALNFSKWVEDINQLSRTHLKSTVDTIHHAGTYNCRKQRGSGVLSEHGYANGIDIRGFNVGGKRYNIKEHWNDPRGMRFLRKALSSACWEFGLALGPQSDHRHLDHFHMDNGNYFGISKVRCMFN